jgi:glycosyltransferase 2 family protein
MDCLPCAPVSGMEAQVSRAISASFQEDATRMKTIMDRLWPLVGLGAVVFSGWLLWQEFQGSSMSELLETLRAIPPHRWGLAILATLCAYAALAWYDRIALLHLGKADGISWRYISLCSFTTYALSHNIGASVFSGGMVRYRAYSAKGLTAVEVAVLVAFCSFTFAFGMMLCGGIVFTFEPDLVRQLFASMGVNLLENTARLIGIGCLAFVALYMIGAALRLRPLVLGKFSLAYPSLPIALRQFLAAPMEIVGAAAIIYFALPEQGNPGLFVILGIFVAVFSAALISQAPGGLGVMELLFIKALPDIPKIEVLAAVLVFRLLYLIIPLALAIPIVLGFEKAQLKKKQDDAKQAD